MFRQAAQVISYLELFLLLVVYPAQSLHISSSQIQFQKVRICGNTIKQFWIKAFYMCKILRCAVVLLIQAVKLFPACCLYLFAFFVYVFQIGTASFCHIFFILLLPVYQAEHRCTHSYSHRAYAKCHKCSIWCAHDSSQQHHKAEHDYRWHERCDYIKLRLCRYGAWIKYLYRCVIPFYLYTCISYEYRICSLYIEAFRSDFHSVCPYTPIIEI